MLPIDSSSLAVGPARGNEATVKLEFENVESFPNRQDQCIEKSVFEFIYLILHEISPLRHVIT